MAEGRNWIEMQDDPCPDCGCDASIVNDMYLAQSCVDAVVTWGRTLAGGPLDWLRVRPEPEVWSPIEYACHARDVMKIFTRRISQARFQPGAEMGWWDHEAAVLDEAYNEQGLALVVEQMQYEVKEFGEALAALQPHEWDIAVQRRPGEHFTVRGMARFVLHELLHHRWDAERILAQAPS